MERTVLRLLVAVAAFSLAWVCLPPSGLCRTHAIIVRPHPRLPEAAEWAMPRDFRATRGYLPCGALNRAVHYLRTHRSEFPNRRFLTIIDYTEPSTSKRFFLIDLDTGTVTRLLVSHGKNSGKLYATRFSNRPDSLESPCGFFLTGPEYYGPHGPSMVLYGLQKGINDNSFARKIVMHGAYYVSRGAIRLNRRLHGMARLGLSEGCPAIPMSEAQVVINKIKNGSLLYVYSGR